MGRLARRSDVVPAERLPHADQALRFHAIRFLEKHGYFPSRIVRVDPDAITYVRKRDGVLCTAWIAVRHDPESETDRVRVRVDEGLPVEPSAEV